jgi:GAF domain-containing protein
VVPLTIGGRLSGVLDIDSPEPARFGAADRELIEAVVGVYAEACVA